MSRPTAAVINRYQRKVYRQIKIDVKIAKADRFKELVKQNNDTISGILSKAIDDYITAHGGMDNKKSDV